VRYGFATFSTDTGHNASVADGTWALNSPEKRTDFGWRAIHGTCVLGKAITEAFYGDKIAYSYYAGASTGGRQGLKEVEISPDSFDGVLVGAPAWWLSHLSMWTTKLGIYNLPTTDPKNIGLTQIAALADEVVKQCDKLDGVEDGIVSYPDLCHVNLDALLCHGGANTSKCLNPCQVQTVRNVYSDYYADGKFAFPGFEVSSEAQWPVVLSGPTPNPLGADYVADFLLNDPNWTWQSYHNSLVWLADRVDPGDCTADNYDLSPFRNRGGKIVMNHGLSDGLIASRSSEVFYESVAREMTGGDVEALQSWFKFYFIPGMQHVGGTAVEAPWYIAGGDQAGILGSDVYSVPGFEDPKHDVMMALMDWVEKGIDFYEMIATVYKNVTNLESGVLRQRPICPFPQRQVYNGRGDPDVPSSWHCG
jgi:feruloyl esterase